MCFKGKCLYCIPVEYGCLGFAILSAILTSVMTIICLRLLVLHATFDEIAMSDRFFFLNVPSCILFLLGHIFSILLCIGICKRRPGLVMAYFIYGLVMIKLLVAVTIILVMTNWLILEIDEMWLLVLLVVVCVIYGLILWMVYESYTKFRSETVSTDRIRLVTGENYQQSSD